VKTFTWTYIGNMLQKLLKPLSQVSILATSVRSDMVLIGGLDVTLIELTLPHDSRETPTT